MLSNKVADVLFQRVIDMCGGVSPEIMCNIDAEQLRKIGISYRKSNTISELTQAVISRDLDLYKLSSLPDGGGHQGADLNKRDRYVDGKNVSDLCSGPTRYITVRGRCIFTVLLLAVSYTGMQSEGC